MKIKFEVDVTDIITDIVNYTHTEDESAKRDEIKEELKLELKESFREEVLKQLIPKVNIKSLNDQLRVDLYESGLEFMKERSDLLFNEPTKELLIRGVALEFMRAFKEEFYRRVVQEFKNDANILQEI